jgi:hypothetical protein
MNGPELGSYVEAVDVFVETEVEALRWRPSWTSRAVGAAGGGPDVLRPLCVDDGRVTMPLDAYVVTAARPPSVEEPSDDRAHPPQTT